MGSAEKAPITQRPRLPDGIHFAIGNAILGDLTPEHIELIARLGFPGIEPYRSWTSAYLDRPQALKELLDRHGVTMVTCSNGGPGQAMEFIDPAGRQQTIDDHVAFARDFLSVFGCEHFKINMGRRSPQGTSDDDLKALADALNELGRRTADLGIRLAPHPHIWGPVERAHEIWRLLELTDPAYVWLTLDTAHVNLGGGDPVEFVDKAYDRIAAIHWKDTKAGYRGYAGPTPTQAMHREEILYKDLGSGGVDLQKVWQILNERGYRYWITLDLDPPRPNEGEGTPEEKLEINKRFLTDTLGVTQL
jgi:inosose dehydratase